MAKDKLCKNCKCRVDKKCAKKGEYVPRKASCDEFKAK
jgi:hypothetical protein